MPNVKKNIDGKRTCKQCQIDFTFSTTFRNHCSVECRRTYNLAASKERAATHRLKIDRKRNCQTCDSEFKTHDGAKYCSIQCKLNWTKTRRKPAQQYNNICMTCSKAFKHKNQKLYCSPECYQLKLVTNREGYEKTRKAERNQRERSAVGLSVFEVNSLRTQWINDERTCIYCGGFPDTVDHITPLVRGGTNEIFNLAPCCKSCNSSKGSKLIHEWMQSKVQAS